MLKHLNELKDVLSPKEFDAEVGKAVKAMLDEQLKPLREAAAKKAEQKSTKKASAKK